MKTTDENIREHAFQALREANEQLRAQWEELLEALATLVENIEHTTVVNVQAPTPLSGYVNLDRAKAAIAKAKGGQA